MSADDDLFSPIWGGTPITKRIDEVSMRDETVRAITERLDKMSFGDEIVFMHAHDGTVSRYYLTLRDRKTTY
jgi:hypothetical protein